MPLQQQLQDLIKKINQNINAIQQFSDFEAIIQLIRITLFDTLGDTIESPISDLLKKTLGLNSADITNELIELTRIFAFLEANNTIKAIFIAMNAGQDITLDFLKTHIHTEKEGKDQDKFVIRKAMLLTHTDKTRLYPAYIIEKLNQAFHAIQQLDPTKEHTDEDSDISAATKRRWKQDLDKEDAAVTASQASTNRSTFEDWLVLTDEELHQIERSSQPHKTSKYDPILRDSYYRDHTQLTDPKLLAFHMAIYDGDQQTVLKFIREKFDINGQYDRPGRRVSPSPLAVAFERGQYKIAMLLLQHGAKYNKMERFGSHFVFCLDELSLKLVFRQLFLDIQRNNPGSDIETYKTAISTILSFKDDNGRPFINIVRDIHIGNKLTREAKDKLLNVFSPFLTWEMVTAGKHSLLKSIVTEQPGYSGPTAETIERMPPTISALTMQRQIQIGLALEYRKTTAAIAAAAATESTEPSANTAETAIVLASSALTTTSIWRESVNQLRTLVVNALAYSNLTHLKALLLIDSTLLYKREKGYNALEEALVFIIRDYVGINQSLNTTRVLSELFTFICEDLLKDKSTEEKAKFCASIFSNLIVSGIKNLDDWRHSKRLEQNIKTPFLEEALATQPEILVIVHQHLDCLLNSVISLRSKESNIFEAFGEKFFGEDSDRKTITVEDRQILIFLFNILANLHRLKTLEEQHAVVCSFLTSAFVTKLIPRQSISAIASLPVKEQCETLKAMGSFYSANFPLQQTASDKHNLQDRFIEQLLLLKEHLERELENHSFLAAICGTPEQLKTVKLLIAYLTCLRGVNMDDSRLSALFQSGLFQTVSAALAMPKLPLLVQSAITDIVRSEDFTDFTVTAIEDNTVRRITIINGAAAPPSYEDLKNNTLGSKK